MADYTTMFAPLLFGLLLIAAINRVIVFWQQEQTPRIFYEAVTYSCLFMLYLASALEWPSFWRDVARVILIWALVLGNWHEWRKLFVFLHKKELRQAQLPDPSIDSVLVDVPATLKDLSEAGNAVAIEASEKTTINDKDYG